MCRCVDPSVNGRRPKWTKGDVHLKVRSIDQNGRASARMRARIRGSDRTADVFWAVTVVHFAGRPDRTGPHRSGPSWRPPAKKEWRTVHSSLCRSTDSTFTPVPRKVNQSTSILDILKGTFSCDSGGPVHQAKQSQSSKTKSLMIVTKFNAA